MNILRSQMKSFYSNFTSARHLLDQPMISTLSNGVRVVSLDSPGHFVSVGAYIHAGSRYEDPSCFGASHIIDRMAFKATADFETETLVKHLEEMGGNIASQSFREHMMFQATVFRKDLDRIMPILASIVCRPKFSQEDVEDVKRTTAYEIQDNEYKADVTVPQILHQSAYGGGDIVHANSLGRPTICGLDQLKLITPQTLHRFRSIWFTSNRIVVAGVGMPHQELERLAQEHFSSLPTATTDTIDYQNTLISKSQYTGGIKFLDTSNEPPSPNPDDVPLTHVYLGFESVPVTDPDVYSVATLSTLLGGGGSFSAGGPGKGMYTRLYRNVLNQYHWIENCNNLNFNYSDSGLFGIHASVPPHPEAHRAIVPVLCDQMQQAIQGIGVEELGRAKNQLKSNLLMGVESKSVQLEDLAHQMLIFNKYVDLRETCRRIDMVQAEDLTRVATRIFKGVDIPSRFNFDESLSHSVKRTGLGQVTAVIKGPLKRRDALYKIQNTLTEWEIGQKSTISNKKSFFSKFQ